MPPLQEYRRKRNFQVTPEPSASGAKSGKERRFVIQKHDASRLHYDFRLELGRTLISWAVPKGLPLKHGEKHLAVHVEDHPLSYFDFEGTIPQGEYGGGTVQVWDQGTWTPQSTTPARELKDGKLHFTLKGGKLSGEWYLVQLHGGENWLIIRAGGDHPKLTKKVENASALTGRTLTEIARDKPPAANAKTAAAKKAGTKAKAAGKSRPAVKTKTESASGPDPEKQPSTRLAPEDIKFIEPMKARLVDSAPEGEWAYEVKFDGFRALACKRGPAVLLLSRTNHDLTSDFPEVAAAVSRLKVENAVIDGEITALDPKGVSSFQLLQAYELGQEKPPLFYYVFDLLERDGKSLRQEPLEERKKQLESLLPEKPGAIRFSATLGHDADALLKMAGRHGLEGLIGKRAGSGYEAGRRSGTWIKLKLVKEQEFVIGGYTDPEGSRAHFGALLLGVQENGGLRYVGKVGTGFNASLLADLHRRMSRLGRESCPFENLPETSAGRYGAGLTAAAMKRCHWLKPSLVGQVRFSEWTRDGRLRQPVFLGLRKDKPATSVVREIPVTSAE
ncbi:MAG: non-homologous end-joining DNA ligase [Verrucomicrobiota bacterium]